MLLTPGPVPLAPFVQEAMQRPIMAHRSDAFTSFYGKLLRQLRYLFQTEKGVTGTLASSGTGGVEAGMYSLFSQGDKVAIVSMHVETI